MKNNRIAAVKTLLCCGLVLVLGMILAAGFPRYRQNWEAQKEKNELQWETIEKEAEAEASGQITESFYSISCWLYWQQKQQESGVALTPAQVFMPENSQEYQESFNEVFSENLRDYMHFFRGIGGHYYLEMEINGSKGLVKDGVQKTADAVSDIMSEYPYVWELQFDRQGSVTLLKSSLDEGMADASRLQLMQVSMLNLFDHLGIDMIGLSEMQTPADMTVIFAMENEEWIEHYSSYSYAWYQQELSLEEVLTSGFGISFVVLLLVTVLLGLLLPLARRLELGNGWVGRIPFELWFILILFAFAAAAELGRDYLILVRESMQGNLAEILCENFVSMTPAVANGLVFGINSLIPALVFGFVLAAVISLRKIFSLGPREYIKQNFLCVRVIRWFLRKGKALLQHLSRIDLSAGTTRWLIKVLGVNFLLVAFCCCLWFGGIAGAIVYSVFLFFLLQRYLNRIQEQFQAVQGALHQMAEGNLSADIPDDLGTFEPLGREMVQVREGFRQAVDEEVRSRNLKTELITNVSHDLKTPLTAIITYINLLKDNTGTEEEKKEYIETLDRKAMRLKQLIEDLFEVSKAASGDIKVEKRTVDVAELTRQVALELEDLLTAAQVQLRLKVPEGKVLALLDGSKMYRILENLLGNVAKYSMPGTRAYLTLEADAQNLRIEVKNISRNELSEDISLLKERLVRDDKARSTEGSGLGLTIVDSFVNLQGGSFAVEADGDLFRAVVALPRGNYILTENEM